ncbi:MAG: class I SAM-dependent methyltransferase, partial [Bacteroidota bacterium]
NALKNPVAVMSFALGNKHSLHEAIILRSAAYLFGARWKKADWKNALNEIHSGELVPQVNNINNIKVGNNINTTFGKWIYCCVRVVKPKIIVETGVSHGSSSWIILNALHKNKTGQLISVDLPDNDLNSNYNFNGSAQTGWLVPAELRNQWNLQLGDAKKILPQLLEKSKEIDLFFHDSDHSFEHMQWEFNTIFPYLIKDGLVLSDDVHQHAAFPEFVAKNNLRALTFNKGGCAIKSK